MRNFVVVVFSSLAIAIYGNFINATNESSCICPWRLFQHYLSMGCEIRQTDTCGCPTKFSCSPHRNAVEQTANACVYHGISYEIGARINTTDKCLVCRCVDVGNPVPRIFCRQKKCLVTDIPQHQDCHLIYRDDDSCCPTGVNCKSESQESAMSTNETACVVGGVPYPEGARLPSKSDLCEVCTCRLPWDGVGRCRRRDCGFQRHRHRLDRGCVPVYHETKCCPIEFYCPKASLTSNLTLTDYMDSTSLDAFDNDNCIFGNVSYALGTSLKSGNPCIDCSCAVPPFFTCIHKSCPNPPAPGKECTSTRGQGQCCREYQCGTPSHSDEDQTANDTGSQTIEEESSTHQIQKSSPILPVEIDTSIQQATDNSSMNQVENVDPQSSQNTDVEDSNNFITNYLRKKRSASNQQHSDRSYQQHNQQVEEGFDLESNERDPDVYEEEGSETIGEIRMMGRSAYNEVADTYPNVDWDKVIWTSFVPGCPTPLCANSSCRIGIPPGQSCPTCICKYGEIRQP